jgi:S1-C subfamily serine protease
VSRLTHALAGLLGGLVVLIAAAGLIAGGVIETGDGQREVVRQAPITQSVGTPSRGEGKDRGETVNDIYRRTGPGVVFVEARGGAGGEEDPFGTPERDGAATGSGFVMDREGYVITNAHVVEGADSVRVRFGDEAFEDARVVGADPSSDLALLRIEDPDEDQLRPLELGDSKRVEVGDPTVAVGNPFGLSRTVTTGIVSALQRQIEAPNSFPIDNVIQTDAAVNPGNSGGPLLDGAGRVIGVNSQIATGGSNGSVGIAFAVPIDTVKEVVPQLKRAGKVERAFLGVTTAPVGELAEAAKLPAREGALVQDVQPDGPADDAGLRAGRSQSDTGIVLGGDLIVRVAGRPVSEPDDLAAAIGGRRPGDEVDIEFFRGRDRKTVRAELGRRPDAGSPGGLGGQDEGPGQLPESPDGGLPLP